MASFLSTFNARLATYVAELERLQTRNIQEHAFHPTFWMEHHDFTVARDVFVAVRSPVRCDAAHCLILRVIVSRRAGPSDTR
jgi:hypothetical protein